MTIRTRALFLMGLIVAVSCSDSGNPLSSGGEEPQPLPPASVVALDCTVSISGGGMHCALPQPGTGAASGSGELIVGGQNVYVRLAASNFSTPADTIQFDVTVENLIPQALGTTDGVSTHPDGVRVFFYDGPVSNNPSAAASVANADGDAFFTAANQPYFQWNEILAPNETSAPRTWKIQYTPGSTSVSFRVYVWAQVQYENGWVDVTPAADTLQPGEVVDLDAIAYDYVGRSIGVANQDFTWSVAGDSVTSVDPATGEVTALTGAGSGTDTIFAMNEDSVIGRAEIHVNSPLQVADTTYAAIGNVTVGIDSASGLRNVAIDPDGTVVTFLGDTVATAEGGTVVFSSNGGFQYWSAAGFVGRDSVQYTATDGVNQASAWLKLVSDRRFWFVSGGAAGDRTGTDQAPFAGLDEAAVAWTAGDTVLIADGDGTDVLAGVALLDSIALLGAGFGDFAVELNGDSLVLLPSGIAPTVTRATAGATLTLGQDNTVRGLVLASTDGAAILGSGFGTLTTGTLTVDATGPALDLTNGALDVSFIQLSSTGSSTRGLRLTDVTGTLAPAGGGFSGAAAGAVYVSGGDVVLQYAGLVTQSVAAPLLEVVGGHTGSIEMSGTLTDSAGTGLQFNDADGSYTFSGSTTLDGGNAGIDIENGSDGTFTFGTGTEITSPSGTAFNVYGSSPTVVYSGGIAKGNAGAMIEVGEQPGGSVTFQTGTLSASAGSGISLSNADGTVAFNGTTTLSGGPSIAVVGGSAGTISFASGASVTNPASAGLLLSASAPTLTYAGSISSNAARPVQIEGMTGGSVAVSGSVSGTGNGILVQNNNTGSAKTITFSGAVTLSTGANEAVTLANNAGATIGFTGGATDLTTTTGNAFAATGGGTVNLSGGSNDIATSTGSALLLNGVTLGASGMSLATLNVTGAAVAPVVITNAGVTTGSGITVSGGSIVAGAGTRVAVNGGTVNVTWAGNVSQSTHSASLLSVAGGHTTGTLAFSGTLAASSGNGLQFNNAAGTYNFTGTTTLNGGDAGIDILNGSSGTFSFNGSTGIANATNELIAILNSSPTLTYSGSFSRTIGNATGILAQGNNGGTMTFDGDGTTADGDPADVTKSLSTGSANAISLVSNSGASFVFGGGMALATTSGTGLNATGGGTVVVTGAGNTVNASAGGTAVNIQNTTIGGSGVSFYSVNATGGGANGIVLNNTGSGGFQVVGDGASDAANTTRGRTTARSGGGTITLGSGGTISGKTNDAIQLTTTGAVTLRNLVVQNNAGDGIQASAVGGLTIDNALISGHQDNSGIFSTGVSAPVVVHSQIENNAYGAGAPGADIHNVRLISNTGTGSVRHSVIANTSAGAERQLQVFSTSGTLNITVENTRIAGSTIGDGVGVYAFGSSNITASFQNDSIHNNSAFGIDAGTETTQSATLNITVNNTRFHNNFVGVTVAHGSSGTNTFNVTNNNFQNHGSISVNINRLGGGGFTSFGLFSGTVSGNTIGTAGTANSGSASGSPIRVVTNGNGGTSRVSILNNTIREYAEHAITVVPRDANSGQTLHTRIQNNSIANPHAFALDGVNVTMGALNTDVISLCLDIGGAGGAGGNAVNNSPRNGIRVRSSGLPAANVTLTAPGYDGTGATYFANRNPAATGASGNASFSNGSGTTSAGNCTTP